MTSTVEARCKRTIPEKIFLKRSKSIYDGMKRRARKEFQSLDFTLEEFRAWLLSKFNAGAGGITRCHYSGRVLTAEDFCVDHSRPISRAGWFGLDNLVVCAEWENLRKGNMMADEYAVFRDFVNKVIPGAAESIWKRLQVGDVQRYSHFRRQSKERKLREAGRTTR